MKKYLFKFFIATSLFAIFWTSSLFFACKGTGKEDLDVKEDATLILKSLKVGDEKVTNITERPMNVSVANDKVSLSSVNVEATFDYDSKKDEPIAVKIEGAGNLKEGVATPCTLSVDALKGEYKRWSAKINVTRLANGGGSQEQKTIEVDKIILGYPNISDRDGKEVRGEDLTQDLTIPDFTVPDAKFPVQVHHKSQFTVEEVEISVNGGAKEKIASITKLMIGRDFTLVKDAKTKFEIYITGQGYYPLKLTFNVTYVEPDKKYLDDITNIFVTTNKKGNKEIYGGIGQRISLLAGGKTTINVSIAQPTIKIIVNKGSGEKQAKADISIDDNKVNKDFPQNSGVLEFNTDTLSQGSHSVKIKITKEGYEAGDYDFKLNYKPFLTFKEMKINNATYTDEDQIQMKTFKLEPQDTDPVVLSGKMQEDGVDLYFSQAKKGSDGKVKYHKITDSKISVPEGEILSLRMYAKKMGYEDFKLSFRIQRKKGKEKIEVKNIEVGSKAIEDGGSVTLTQEAVSTRLVLTLKQKYEGITFKINDNPTTPSLGIYGMIATFDNLALTKDGSKTFVLKAEAPDFLEWTANITIVHATPQQEQSYIIEPKIGYFDPDEGWIDYDLKPEGSNWKSSCDESTNHRFVIKIQKKDKSLDDTSKFKLSIVDKKSDGDKTYLDKATTSIVDRVKGHLTWQRDRGTDGKDIKLAKGVHDFEVKIFFGDELLETTHFDIKIGN